MSLLAPVSGVGVGGALLGCGTGKVLLDLITGLQSLLAAAKRTKGAGLDYLKKRHLTRKRRKELCACTRHQWQEAGTLILQGLVCVIHVYEDTHLYGGHRPTLGTISWELSTLFFNTRSLNGT